MLNAQIIYYLSLVLIAGSVFLILTNLANLFLLKQRFPLRMEAMASSYPSYPQSFFLNRFSFLDKILARLNFLLKPISDLTYLQKLRQELEVLKINANIPALVLGKILLAIISVVLSFFFLPIYSPLAGLIGFFILDIILKLKIRRKKEAIAEVFPETIDLLDMCISAGIDFVSAVKWVVNKSQSNPFVEQLALVLNEIQIGKSREEALKDMAKRLKIPNVSSFVRTIIISARMGTSIEETFRSLSEDTRNIRFQKGERYAIRASLKILFPLLFCILPAIMIVVAGPIFIKFMEGGLIPQAP